MKLGDFVWYELCTPEPAAAAAFYAQVVGWAVHLSGVPGVEYRLLSVGDRQVAGIMSLPPEQMPPRPVWFGYVGTEDVDAKATEVEAAGGAIHKAPQDIPTIGRFAVVADPQGAVFLLFKGLGKAPAPLPVMQNGTIGWHELHTRDWEKDWSFYERLFGWSKDAVHDLGPMGKYQLFKTSAMPVGGMLSDARAPHPYWLYYFVVDNIDAARERVEAHGGTVLFGPQEVPGGAWIVNAEDPQGGIFALVGTRNG